MSDAAADGLENRWADPDGYERSAQPVRYRIRQQRPDGTPGELVERRTELTLDPVRQRYYHAFAAADQHYGYRVRELVQLACAYFYDHSDTYRPLEGVPEIVISDDAVRERIRRIDEGENAREAERTRELRYPLQELPFALQRALVEQIEALKARWGFAIIGEVEPRAEET